MWGGREGVGCEEKVCQKGVRTWSRSKCLRETVGLGVEGDVEKTEVDGFKRGEGEMYVQYVCVFRCDRLFFKVSKCVHTHTHTLTSAQPLSLNPHPCATGRRQAAAGTGWGRDRQLLRVPLCEV